MNTIEIRNLERVSFYEKEVVRFGASYQEVNSIGGDIKNFLAQKGFVCDMEIKDEN